LPGVGKAGVTFRQNSQAKVEQNLRCVATEKTQLSTPHEKTPCGKPLKDTDLNIYLIEDNIICTKSALRWRSAAVAKMGVLKNWTLLVFFCVWREDSQGRYGECFDDFATRRPVVAL
jgi:hypothetical protein